MTFDEAVKELRDLNLTVDPAEEDAFANHDVERVFAVMAIILDSIPEPPTPEARLFVGWARGGWNVMYGCDACSECRAGAGYSLCERSGSESTARRPDLRGPGCPWYEEGK